MSRRWQRVDRSGLPTDESSLAHAAWRLTRATVFRFSPERAHGWRRMLLRLHGARIGRGVRVYPTARITSPWNLRMDEHSCLGRHATCHAMGRVVIGAHATVCREAFLCAAGRDLADPLFGPTRPPIRIGHSAWVATGAFVGPGVSVGEGAVVGARACAFSRVDPWTVVVGNPARFLKRRRLKPNTGPASRRALPH